MAEVVAEFDEVAGAYRAQHAHSPGVSVEALDYFASYKIEYLKNLLQARGRPPEALFDFGAGVGNAPPPLPEAFSGGAHTAPHFH